MAFPELAWVAVSLLAFAFDCIDTSGGVVASTLVFQHLCDDKIDLLMELLSILHGVFLPSEGDNFRICRPHFEGMFCGIYLVMCFIFFGLGLFVVDKGTSLCFRIIFWI